MSYFMDFKKTCEELNMLLLYSSDVKVQQSQREQMVVMSFLAGLPSKFKTAKSQILSSSEIFSLKYIYSRVVRTKGTPPTPPVQFSSSLVSRKNEYEYGRSHYNSGNKGGGSNSDDFDTRADNSGGNANRGQGLGGIVCHYIYNPGHFKRDCRKLQYKTQKAYSAHIASTNDAPEKSVLISTDEFAKFSKY